MIQKGTGPNCTFSKTVQLGPVPYCIILERSSDIGCNLFKFLGSEFELGIAE